MVYSEILKIKLAIIYIPSNCLIGKALNNSIADLITEV